MAEDVRATTRIPKHIAEWLKAQAKQHHRSMNGQLIECLETLMKGSKNERA